MKLDMRKLSKIPNDSEVGWYYVPDLEYFELIKAELLLLGCRIENDDSMRTAEPEDNLLVYIGGEDEIDSYRAGVPQLYLKGYKELTT